MTATRPRVGFGHADERPYRRLTGDWIALALACLIVGVTAVNARDVPPVGSSIDEFLRSLPGAFDGLFTAVLAIGSLWGIALTLGAALIARRGRLACVLTVAGMAAWFLGRLLGFVVDGQNVGSALGAVFASDRSGPYPAVHLAIIAAVVLVAAPFLTRPVRRLGQIVLIVLAPAVIVLGVGGANAVAGALALGWAIAAGLHLAFGSPAGRPTRAQVGAALAELGVDTDLVELESTQNRGSTLMRARRPDGGLVRVRVYGRDAADTRLAMKLWRFVMYKDSGPTLTLTRLQQVEHEALCLLAAHGAGVAVPGITAAGVAGPSAALLATDGIHDATLRRDLPATDLDNALAQVWDGIGRMRDARIAHGALDADHLRIGPDGSSIIDFDEGSISASPSQLDRDAAQALVTTTLLTDADTAARYAGDAIGGEGLLGARRYLTRPALTPATRRALRADKDLLDRLAETVSAETGDEMVRPIELRRVKPLNLVMVGALLVAVWVILGQVGSLSDLVDTMKTADWPWLGVGFVLAQATSVAFACTTIGSVPQPIALLPATMLQMAVSFANLVAPTSASSTIMNIRFLQKQGVEVGAATSSGVLAGLSGTITQLGLFVITAFAVGQQASLSEVGGGAGTDGSWLLTIVFVGAGVIGIAFAIPWVRRVASEKVWPQVVVALRNIWGILTTPRQLGLILGGSIAAQLLYSFCLLACLHAYGASLSVGEIIFVNTSASFLAGLVPVPGGIGVAEATLVAGLTAFGIPPEIATATVITHRLFTTYLPPIWGSYAMKRLIAEGYL